MPTQSMFLSIRAKLCDRATFKSVYGDAEGEKFFMLDAGTAASATEQVPNFTPEPHNAAGMRRSPSPVLAETGSRIAESGGTKMSVSFKTSVLTRVYEYLTIVVHPGLVI